MNLKRSNPVSMFIRTIFISPSEPRLRALWRLLLHGSLTIALVLIVGSLFVVIITVLGGDATNSLLINLIPLAAILLATWIARRILDHRTFRSLGFNFDRQALADLAFGFALPALLFGLIFAFEWGMGWISFQGWAWDSYTPAQTAYLLLTSLGIFIIVGVQEEALSRGYHLQNMAEAMSMQWAVFLSSAVFAILHLANPGASIGAILGILAAGYFLAFAWIRTRNLWLPIGLHIGWNFFEGTIFGFPVSGTQSFNLIRQTVQGPELITGGTFGPEAGLVVFPAIILGALLIWVYTRTRSTRKSRFAERVTR